MPRVTSGGLWVRIPWSSRSSHHCDPVARLDVGAGEGRHAGGWPRAGGGSRLWTSAVGVECGREHAQREGVSVDSVVGDAADRGACERWFDPSWCPTFTREEGQMESGPRLGGARWPARRGRARCRGAAGAPQPAIPAYGRLGCATGPVISTCGAVERSWTGPSAPTSSWSLPVTTARRDEGRTVGGSRSATVPCRARRQLASGVSTARGPEFGGLLGRPPSRWSTSGRHRSRAGGQADHRHPSLCPTSPPSRTMSSPCWLPATCCASASRGKPPGANVRA